MELVPPSSSIYDGFVITADGESQTLTSEPYEATFENLVPGVEYSVSAYTYLGDLTSQTLQDFDPITVTTGTITFLIFRTLLQQNLVLTHSIQDSETSIDSVQGPPGSLREWVNKVIYLLPQFRISLYCIVYATLM